jgi:ribulose-5-phosphate 4-epimerase/fuculose-1-phosphate aldolase
MSSFTGEKAVIAEKIAQSCRIMGKLELTHGALGHVSYRAEGADTILIKGKGVEEAGLRYTQASDVLEVDFDAEKVDGPDGLQPPSESFIHLWIYRQHPEVRSVAHVHPDHAVLLTIGQKEIRPILGAYDIPAAQMALDGVDTYHRSVTVSNDELGEEFATFMGDKKVALMRGHGISASGSSIEDVTVRCLTANRLVSMMYKAYLIGDPKPISDEDIAVLRAPLDPARTRGSAGGEVGMLASYRYYRSLAGEEPIA